MDCDQTGDLSSRPYLRRFTYATHLNQDHVEQPEMMHLGDDVDIREPSAELEERAPTPRQDESISGEDDLFGDGSPVSRQPKDLMHEPA